MKIYREWDAAGKSFDFNGKKIVVAPEDLKKDENDDLWQVNEVAEAITELAGGWRLPTRKEFLAMVEKGNFGLEENRDYWVMNGKELSFARSRSNLPVYEVHPNSLIVCRIRCVCELAGIME